MMGENIYHELKSVLKLHKPPVDLKRSLISKWKKKDLEQRVAKVLAGGVAWFVCASTLASLLLRRSNGA